MAGAARVFWTFRMLGHDKVSLLDGGIAAWAGLANPPAEQGPATATPAEFRPGEPSGALLATKDDVAQALKGGDATLLDVRSYGEFMGVIKTTPRAGTVPGSKHLPFNWLTADDGPFLRPAEDVRRLMGAMEVPAEGPVIVFCTTGYRAALGWFALHEILNNRQALLYDGSMAEWTRDADAPLVQHISLD